MEMEYRRLGRSGLKVSALSLGSWVTFGQQIEDKVAEKLMHTAYEAGVNFFDNAEAYAGGRSEEIMGKILARSGWSRDSFIVSSKVYWGGDKPTQRGISRKHIVDACNHALRRLQVDYLDLYFCHRPDLETPIEETVAAMTDLIRQGKVLYWGTSEWTARDIAQAHAAASQYQLYGPTMEQPQYNLFHRDRVEVEYSRLYKDVGLGTTIWSPLASGLLTGKYLEGEPGQTRFSLQGYEWLRERLKGDLFEERRRQITELSRLADQLEISMPRLALSWCLKNPNVSTVILGASRVEQLEENLRAIEDYRRIDQEVLEEVDEILGNRPEPEENFA